MSETFSAPHSATTGLQRYDLEPKPKQLFPGVGGGDARNRRLLAFSIKAAKYKRRQPKSANSLNHMTKDAPMQEIAAQMIATLQKSVEDIVAANPADLQAQLAKSFTEFGEALNEEIDSTLEAAVDFGKSQEGEGLYKGMGTVGRVVDLAHHIARKVKQIKEGRDYEGGDSNDECSEGVAELLEHAQAASELAMHHAVNEHVEGADGDDPDHMPDGVHMIAVPSHAGGHIVVKTTLPEDLAKFAMDPTILAEAAAELGIGMLLAAGVPEENLGKVFGDGNLSKTFPPKKDGGGASDGGSSEAADTSDGGEDPTGGDPTGGMDQSGGDPSGGQDFDDPLQLALRIWAALGVQLQHVAEIIEGGGEQAGAAAGQADASAPMDDGSGDASADGEGTGAAPADAADPSAGVAPPKKTMKAAGGGDNLHKGLTQDALQKMIDEAAEAKLAPFRDDLAKLLSQPVPDKAQVGASATMMLSKEADNGRATAGSEDADLEDLKKRNPEAYRLELTKRSYRTPIPLIKPNA